MKKRVNRMVPNRGTRFAEGQARLYYSAATAKQAHDTAVCRGFCYSIVVEDRRMHTFTLFVRGKR